MAICMDNSSPYIWWYSLFDNGFRRETTMGWQRDDGERTTLIWVEPATFSEVRYNFFLKVIVSKNRSYIISISYGPCHMRLRLWHFVLVFVLHFVLVYESLFISHTLCALLRRLHSESLIQPLCISYTVYELKPNMWSIPNLGYTLFANQTDLISLPTLTANTVTLWG